MNSSENTKNILTQLENIFPKRPNGMFGHCIIENNGYECVFRFGNHANKGGFEMCLYIPGGHDHFGDDKFEVIEVLSLGIRLLTLEIMFPLSLKEYLPPYSKKVKLYLLDEKSQ